MAIELTDDGTMDTVLRCSECGEEFRFNPDLFGSELFDADNPHERIEQDEPGGYWRVRHADGSLMSLGHLTYEGAESALAELLRDEWIAEQIIETEIEHECTAAEPSEPSEGDITTEDHRTFYQDGRKVLEYSQDHKGAYAYINGARFLGRFDTVEAAVRAYMARVQYFPNCWFISDHGNAHLMDLSEGSKEHPAR